MPHNSLQAGRVAETYKGEPKPKNFEETKVTTTKDNETALEAIRKGRTQPPARSRVTEPAQYNPGQFILPGL